MPVSLCAKPTGQAQEDKCVQRDIPHLAQRARPLWHHQQLPTRPAPERTGRLERDQRGVGADGAAADSSCPQDEPDLRQVQGRALWEPLVH